MLRKQISTGDLVAKLIYYVHVIIFLFAIL
jgi:hypothetical protein